MVKELYWHEDKGRYYSHYDVGQLYIGDPPYDSMEEIEAAGYTIVLEDQPVDYTITGSAEALPRPLYQDQASNRYFYDFDYNLYSISDDNTITYGSGKYYIGALAEGVDEDALQKVEHEELCDDFKWWIEGTEYHHIGTGEQACILGDADGDGSVEIRDATWIQRHDANIEIPFAISKTTADVDGDNNITVMDVTAIQYYLANMKTSYKIGEKIE